RMGVTPRRVRAWLGPAIGPTAFEVGDEVRAAFVGADPGATAAFVAGGVPGKWLADLCALARRRLTLAGVERIDGGSVCTVADPAHFYSYRRDGTTGRFAALIWLEEGRPGAIA
uniref:polyphenol oxidase family protein n=1 Tax=Thauera aminoaromatica TaxID=164330 RepID=UPI0035AD7869